MRSRRTHKTNVIHRLEGGTEDNDLWGYYLTDSKNNIINCTVWEPTKEERERIANGENIRLLMWSETTPPLAMDLVDEPLGKRPNDAETEET